MQDSKWQTMVELATALNASEELQTEFRDDPRAVLGRYDIGVTDEELEGIRRVLSVSAEGATGTHIVPLPVEHPRIRRGGSDEND